MFAAFLGERVSAEAWRESVAAHGRWLGLTPASAARPLPDEQYFECIWLRPRGAGQPEPAEQAGGWRLCTSASPASPDGDDNLVWLSLALPAGELTVCLPEGTPEQFYFAHSKRAWLLGNDMRLMRRLAGGALDERGLYALFQYGAIPAPLTMARTVNRVPNGHRLVLRPNTAEPKVERWLAIQPAAPTSQDAETRVAETLDDLLVRMAPSTLYFSGGVDSSLMAARLQALGQADVHLINFSFGPDDPEGAQALRVAQHLGLACEQIQYDPDGVAPMLERIGRDYSFPFVDRSVIPTNLLVQASLASIGGNRLVVEGTGADGAFGAWNARSRVADLPRPARALLAGSYGWLKLWQAPTELERVARLARGSMQMSQAHALVIAQNVLDQIGYSMPATARGEVEAALWQHVEAPRAGLALEQQFSFLDLVHICAGIFAAKSFDPLRVDGVRPVYPFLEPPMLRLSASLDYGEKSAPGQAKAVLKRLLARHLPPELIHRPKSGFIPPMQSILAQSEVQAVVHDTVLAQANPVLAYCHQPVLRPLLARAAQDLPLPKGAYRFVWAVIFASCWLKQIDY